MQRWEVSTGSQRDATVPVIATAGTAGYLSSWTAAVGDMDSEERPTEDRADVSREGQEGGRGGEGQERHIYLV